jgi:hypothetical protein
MIIQVNIMDPKSKKIKTAENGNVCSAMNNNKQTITTNSSPRVTNENQFINVFDYKCKINANGIATRCGVNNWNFSRLIRVANKPECELMLKNLSLIRAYRYGDDLRIKQRKRFNRGPCLLVTSMRQ